MLKPLTIITLSLFCVIGYCLWIGVPVFSNKIDCYDNVQSDFDTIEVQSRAQGWSERRRCELRFVQLKELRTCLKTVPKDGKFLEFINTITEKMVFMIRPNIASVNNLINEHDLECNNYPQTMFNPVSSL